MFHWIESKWFRLAYLILVVSLVVFNIVERHYVIAAGWALIGVGFFTQRDAMRSTSQGVNYLVLLNVIASLSGAVLLIVGILRGWS